MAPIPHPDRIWVSFVMEHGQPHMITDPVLLNRVEAIVNAECDGWKDWRSLYGKDAIAQVRYAVCTGCQPTR
jgi:hypothetical protein